MANLILELNIYSAKDLENVNLITKMDVYAVVWINGDDSQKNHKEKTAVDRTGGSEPTWNHAVKFNVDQRLAHEGRLTLVVKLVCDRMFGGKDLGEVQVPVLELLNSSSSFNGDSNGDGNGQGMRFVTYQVRTPCGKGQGSLTFSYRFDMPSFKPDLVAPPVQSNPVEIVHDFPSVSYPPATEAGFYPPLSSIGYPPSSQPQGYPAPSRPYPYSHHYSEQPVTAYPPSPSGSNYPPSSSPLNLYPPPSYDAAPPHHSNVYPPPSYGSSPPQHSNVYPPPSYGSSPPQHSNVYPPPPDKPGHSYHQMQPSQSFHGFAPSSPDKPGHSYHQLQTSQSFHGYAPPSPDKPGHSYHQMQPSHSFHGYAPSSPHTHHAYGYPPPRHVYGCPQTQTPPKKNKPGVGLGMGAGLLGGALGGLLLGDLVSDIGFDL